MGHAFTPFVSLGGSVYWVAFIGVAFIANTSTTLIADATNCKLCPIIAKSNNWTLQALAAGYPSEVGGVRSWGPSVDRKSVV